MQFFQNKVGLHYLAPSRKVLKKRDHSCDCRVMGFFFCNVRDIARTKLKTGDSFLPHNSCFFLMPPSRRCTTKVWRREVNCNHAHPPCTGADSHDSQSNPGGAAPTCNVEPSSPVQPVTAPDATNYVWQRAFLSKEFCSPRCLIHQHHRAPSCFPRRACGASRLQAACL